jgi:hypothetical protein
MVTQGLVMFDSTDIAVAMSANAEPNSVGALLKAAAVNARGNMNALLVEYMNALRSVPNCKAQMYSVPYTGLAVFHGLLQKLGVKYYYKVVTNYTNFFASYYDVNSAGATTLRVYGDFDKLISFQNELAKLVGSIGKIVRFSYNGGTKPGVKVLRLKDVSGNGDKVLLKGADLSQDDSDNFRTYSVSKITSEIEVLN